MRSQRLSGPRPKTVAGVLRDVFALQAQDTRASRLAIRARSEGLDVQAVIHACNQDRTVVRTWAMRGTLHMLPAEDVGWLVGLLGPGLAAGDRRRRLQLGLDDTLLERAVRAIRSVLAADGPLTRAELMRALTQKGVTVDSRTNAAAHLCFSAAALGLICRGPDRADDEPTYVLLDDWVTRRMRSPKDPLGVLASRYLGAYGPAGVPDFAAWAGIPMAAARLGFERLRARLIEVEVSGKPAWMLAGTDRTASVSKPGVRLLGAFDAYLLGYARRDLALSPTFAPRIQAGGGWIHPALVVDGRVVGTWRQQRTAGEPAVTVEPFEPIPRDVRPRIEAEVRDLARFLGHAAAGTSVSLRGRVREAVRRSG
jgi:hypothetical protein